MIDKTVESIKLSRTGRNRGAGAGAGGGGGGQGKRRSDNARNYSLVVTRTLTSISINSLKNSELCKPFLQLRPAVHEAKNSKQ